MVKSRFTFFWKIIVVVSVCARLLAENICAITRGKTTYMRAFNRVVFCGVFFCLSLRAIVFCVVAAHLRIVRERKQI